MNKNEFQLKNICIETQLTFKQIKPKSVNLQISSKDQYESIYKIINPNVPMRFENNIWKYDLRSIHCFSKYQSYRFDVSYDENASVGSVQFQLGELLQQGNQIKNTNYFTVQFSTHLLQKGINILWQWAGEKLLNTDGLFSKSDPFLKFFMWDEGQWNQVYQTEFIENNLNPIWVPFKIDMGLLNYYDESKNFKIECWDHSHKNPPKHKYIGVVEISQAEINASPNKRFKLVNPAHQECGYLKILSSQIEEQQNFQKLLQNIQIQSLLFVEFNKESMNLHQKNHQQLNIFQQFIMQFGSILSQYNKQNLIKLYGFGGLNNNQKNMFQISQGENGIPQVCQEYSQTLKEVKFGDRLELTPALFEIVKQTEIFKPNFTISLVFITSQVVDEDQVKLFLSHQLNLPIITIIVLLSQMDRNIVKLINSETNLSKVKLFQLKEFDANSIKQIKEQIMQVLEKELKIFYNIN